MATLGTNYGQHYAKNSIKALFARAISFQITNDAYEGTVKGGRGDRVNILTFGAVPWQNYTGADISFSDIPEYAGQLVLSVQRSNSFRILNWNRFVSFATDPESQEINMRVNAMKREVDQFNLGFYNMAAKHNIYGTDYTAGTVTVDSLGNVTGVGTTFTASMVGGGFYATGMTAWARVKTFTSATALVLEDDLNDVASQYTSGTATAGASYTLRYTTLLTANNTPGDVANIDNIILGLKERLDSEYTDPATGTAGLVCPDEDRFLVIPSHIHSVLLQSGMLTPYTPKAYEDAVRLGIVGYYRGFKVFKSERLTGNSTTGWNILAGNPMGITHAYVPMGGSIVEDLQANFGKGFKQLVAYGSKVLDARKHFLATALVH
jgi:hypothetical protein